MPLGKIGSTDAGIVYLAGSVQSQNFGPDEDEGFSQVCGSGLQQLEDVGVDAHTEGQVYSPGAHVQEIAQQPQGSQPVHLAQQHLQAGSSFLCFTHCIQSGTFLSIGPAW